MRVRGNIPVSSSVLQIVLWSIISANFCICSDLCAKLQPLLGNYVSCCIILTIPQYPFHLSGWQISNSLLPVVDVSPTDDGKKAWAKKATIHHVTTSKSVQFPGHNHLLTTGTDDPSLYLSPSLVLG